MPHFIVEYTDNIRETGDIPGLLAKANRVLIAQGGVFPTGAIRSRAIELHDYVVADGTSDEFERSGYVEAEQHSRQISVNDPC